MDIQEIINYSKNKIESDDLAKQVRRRIKETAWEKQNQREGFSETFKPLISQFEKPEGPQTKNIFTQNQEMLGNQLALTEGLKANQKAITQGFSQLERLADMRELPQIEDFDDSEETGTDQSDTEKPKKSPTLYDIEKHFDKQDMGTLNDFGYPRPKDFFDSNPKSLQEIYDNVNEDKKIIGNRIGGSEEKKKQNGRTTRSTYSIYIITTWFFK